MKQETKWNLGGLQSSILENKYKQKEEDFESWLDRIACGNEKIKSLMREKKFLFGGRILANRGLNKEGIKVTYSNCYVLEQPEDSIEGIFETAKKLARTFSYGGGVGIDISTLRPKEAKVHNAAKTTTGAVSFMELYSMTTGLIGQRGRRGALMLSMDVKHPDIEEFIDIKRDLEKVTKANISVKITDEFMEAVERGNEYVCEFEVKDTGEKIEKVVDARKVFTRLIENNWDYAEPGILFWDNISTYHLLSEDKEFKFAGVNPCAEEPLPAGGSCLLGSINLSEFVEGAFTEKAKFKMESFKECVREGVRALNEVLDEGIQLHPLEEQRKSVKEYRQIGLGVMGIADMLIKLGIRYGSEKSLKVCDKIGREMINEGLKASSELAKEKGVYPKYKKEKVLNSKFFKENASEETKLLVEKYGLRNSQILTIAPTGSISTMLGVSGGIEPIFNISYVRKTETLHEEDVYYKVYTPIVEEYMKKKGIEKEEDLPDIFVTAMTLSAEERIKMQSVWQKRIDASISSTINLPNEATIEEVYEIYVKAWRYKLKGLTIYRDGCKRSGVLLNEASKKEVEKVKEEAKLEEGYEKFICPECNTEAIIQTGGCGVCLQCGYSKCQ